jgi:hypothetical protein
MLAGKKKTLGVIACGILLVLGGIGGGIYLHHQQKIAVVNERFRQAIATADVVTVTCHDNSASQIKDLVKEFRGEAFKKRVFEGFRGFNKVEYYYDGWRPAGLTLAMPSWAVTTVGPYPLDLNVYYTPHYYFTVIVLDDKTCAYVKFDDALAQRLGISYEEMLARIGSFSLASTVAHYFRIYGALRFLHR